LLDDAVDGREPKSRPLPHFLGGEKGLEDLRQQVRSDPGARVRDSKSGIIGDRQDLAAHLAHIVGAYRISLDGQSPAAVSLALHRIASVDREVDDDLLELARIGSNGAEATAMLDLELHRLAEQALQQGGDLGDDVGQLENLRPEGLLAREGKQLPGQSGRPVRVRADLLDVVIIAVARRVPHQHQVAMADDRGEDVVEIVSDSAGQLADGLHLRRLRDLALEPILLCIVLE
jgi:hypothetical protein